MRRRKRKMRSSSPLSILTHLAFVCSAIVLQPHMVNPTTQISRTDQGREQNASQAPNQASNHHFDDDPNFQLELLSPASRPPVRASTNKSEQISSHQQHQQQPPVRLLTMILKPQDQLERTEAELDDNKGQHLDDLLALESGRSPAVVGSQLIKRHHHQPFVAPYEAPGNANPLSRISQNSSSSAVKLREPTGEHPNKSTSHSISDNETNQLLRLQPLGSPPSPIYLKHNLPASPSTPLRPNQIVAFPHPSSGHSLTGGLESQAGQGSFALLPSWPNIYIAQRERTAPPPPATRPTLLVPMKQDPKVPMNYPDWSRARQEEENATKTLQHELRHDDAGEEAAPRTASDHHTTASPSGRRTNLTTSEVEYEREDEKNSQEDDRFLINRNETSEDKNNNNNNGEKATASADSAQWAKLLRQAVKNNVMESLMITNRSIVSLLCDTHDMLIRLKFKQSFYGMVETNLDPLRQCRLFGNGSQLYEMRIGLLECGTRQELPRLFINNIHIQFRSNNSKQQIEYSKRDARLKLSSEEQQQVASRLLETADEADEVKTLICSYPPPQDPLRPTEPRGPSLNNNFLLSLKEQTSKDLTPTRPYSIAFGGAGRGANITGRNNDLVPLKPADRIIDATNIDDPAGARQIYYEPILLISGLLLLAVAFTLALVSSAYLARRSQRRLLRYGTLSKTDRTSAKLTAGGGNLNDQGPIYRISPSQLANRSGASPLGGAIGVAPPLIGLTKEELLTKRPAAKRYSPTALKELQKSPASDKKRQAAIALPGPSKLTTNQKQQAKSSRPPGDTSDSLESGAKSGSQSESATTIEIPPAGHRVAPQKQQQSQARGANRQSPARKPIAASPPSSSSSEGATPTTRSVKHEEYKHEMSIEKVVEKTTSYRRPSSSSPDSHPPPSNPKGPTPSISTSPRREQQQKAQQQVPPKRQSPVPFGSLRSKLTSPIEYQRLQNISQLFGDTLGGRLDETHQRYKNRIARMMNYRERLDLRKLFQHDEVFRSNVVDSTDLATFKRKLRDDPKYSGKFSQATWNLLQEIMLDPNMCRTPSRSGSSGSSRPGSTKIEEIFASGPSGTRANKSDSSLSGDRSSDEKQPLPLLPPSQGREPAKGQGQVKVTNLDEGHFGRTDVRQEPKKNPKMQQQVSMKGKEDTSKKPNEISQSAKRKAEDAGLAAPGDTRKQTPSTSKMVTNDDDDKGNVSTAVRISQSNSTHTRRDGSTMINIDSVTNISTPRSFSSFTRSSFEQVTRYQEEDSLPYMDEFSQCSIDDQRSLSSSSLEHSKPRRHDRNPSRRP